MKILQKRSKELQQSIVRNQDLLKDLSHIIDKMMSGRIELPDDKTYVFVPRVYSRPVFWPEIYTAASIRERIPFGGAGPLDPQLAVLLDKDRISTARILDPTPEPAKTDLRTQILNDPKLFLQLSEALTEVLSKHDVSFEANETFAFIPVVVDKPMFKGQLAAGTPMPIPPSVQAMIMAERRLWEIHLTEELEFDFEIEFDPGVIIDGIPAPEILVALEQVRIKY